MQPIKHYDLQLGNFISVFGKTEMVKGITPRPDGTFFIHHSSSNQEDNPYGYGIDFEAYPIRLTAEWKKALKADKHEFPKWVEYVHEAQNYMRWYLGLDMFAQMDITAVPLTQEEYFENAE